MKTRPIEKGSFFIELSPTEVLDLGDMDRKEWRKVNEKAKQVIASNQTKNEKIAFVAAFLNYVMEKQAMGKSFKIDA